MLKIVAGFVSAAGFGTGLIMYKSGAVPIDKKTEGNIVKLGVTGLALAGGQVTEFPVDSMGAKLPKIMASTSQNFPMKHVFKTAVQMTVENGVYNGFTKGLGYKIGGRIFALYLPQTGLKISENKSFNDFGLSGLAVVGFMSLGGNALNTAKVRAQLGVSADNGRFNLQQLGSFQKAGFVTATSRNLGLLCTVATLKTPLSSNLKQAGVPDTIASFGGGLGSGIVGALVSTPLHYANQKTLKDGLSNGDILRILRETRVPLTAFITRSVGSGLSFAAAFVIMDFLNEQISK